MDHTERNRFIVNRSGCVTVRFHAYHRHLAIVFETGKSNNRSIVGAHMIFSGVPINPVSSNGENM